MQLLFIEAVKNLKVLTTFVAYVFLDIHTQFVRKDAKDSLAKWASWTTSICGSSNAVNKVGHIVWPYV